MNKGGDKVPYSEAQKRATAKYMKANLEDIKFRVPKGTRERYKAHAESLGMSLNAYIVTLIEKDMVEQILPPKG